MHHRRRKLGDDIVDKLLGTSLGRADELDELVVLNRGAPKGELTKPVQQLIDLATAGEAVSVIRYVKSGGALRREEVNLDNAGEKASADPPPPPASDAKATAASAPHDDIDSDRSAEVARLQALRDLLFPNLRFEVVPVALTVDQVRELGLPSTPLKETEKRADRWRQAFGIEQTEIDALATLQPNVLREIIERAFDPYFDRDLEVRVNEAEDEWLREAQAAIDEQVDPEVLAALRRETAERLAELESVIADINDRLRLAAGDRFDLPAITVPEPEIDEEASMQALVSFGDNWLAATRALIQRKAYGG
jgi:hypothetical protein